MKILHLLLTVLQMPLALISRDQNRIAYLLYLVGWNSKGSNFSSKGHEKIHIKHGNYKETRRDTTNYEHSLLLEQ